MKIESCNTFKKKIIILLSKYKLYREMFVFICEVIWYIRETFASVHYVHVFLGKKLFRQVTKMSSIGNFSNITYTIYNHSEQN